MAKNKSTKIKQEEYWIDNLLYKCEESGISKHLIERFIQYYVKQGGDGDAKSDPATKRARSTSH